ncbi:hypothetical protein [Symbioplanes lichenis]|uniref:hypothetical protein n=1 Tax=Symbioplanes lichenis TaxID=1629072 RepID=UPI00273978D4|nr:hypothetical protein [Actinoplanes lichenis]
MRRATVVTEISDLSAAHRADGKPIVAALRPVRSVVAAIQAAGAVDEAAVFEVFAKQAGPGTAALGGSVPREGVSGEFTVDVDGSVVVYESVVQVDASFTFRCGGGAVSGAISSWRQPRSGIAQCDATMSPAADVLPEVRALAC